MMISQEEKNRIIAIMGSEFLKICKRYRLYPEFRNVYKTNKKITTLLHVKNKKNPFISDLVTFSKRAEEEMNKFHQTDKYDFITHYVNLMLHSYLMPIVHEHYYMCSLGQELFDSVCYEIYGTAYEEEMKKLEENGMPQAHNQREAIMIGEYQMRKAQGENITYQDVVNKYINLSDDEFSRIFNNSTEVNDHYELNEDEREDEGVDDDFFDDIFENDDDF